MTAQILLSFFQVTGGRVIDERSVLGKAGAVAGAVPGVFGGVPFQRAAQMRTALGGGGQQAGHSLQSVQDQLGMQHGAGRGEHLPVRVFLSLHKMLPPVMVFIVVWPGK